MTPLADELEPALLALSAYQQCDMDGVMCAVSRQAVEEIIAAAPAILTALRSERAEAEAAGARAEVERLKALKTPRPQWFYLAGDMSSDKCRFGVHEVIDEDWLWDNRAEGSAVVQIETATPCPDIWCAVRFFTDVEKDERASDDDYEFSEHATEEEARQALGNHRSSTDAD